MLRKERLDTLLTLRGLVASREQAQRCIMAGEVWQGQRRLDKPGLRVASDIALELRLRAPKYVSRAGWKLEFGLNHFGISVKGRVCLDVGASTGGFTDCLLQAGARHVIAVDVGHGQLDVKLQQHPEVTSLEKTNARHLTQQALREACPLGEKVDFVCADASFISLTRLIPPLLLAVPLAADWLLLFKPQFEVGREQVGKGGRVRSADATREALERFDAFMADQGLIRRQPTAASPIEGKKSGNTEILLHYEKA